MNVFSRRALDNADKRIRALEVDLSKWQALVEAEKKHVAEVRRHIHFYWLPVTHLTDTTLQACAFASERGVYMRKLESSLRAADEEISRTRRETEKKIKKLSSAAVPASTREEALKQENEGLWVSILCECASKQLTFSFSENREMHDVQTEHA